MKLQLGNNVVGIPYTSRSGPISTLTAAKCSPRAALTDIKAATSGKIKVAHYTPPLSDLSNLLQLYNARLQLNQAQPRMPTCSNPPATFEHALGTDAASPSRTHSTVTASKTSTDSDSQEQLEQRRQARVALESPPFSPTKATFAEADALPPGLAVPDYNHSDKYKDRPKIFSSSGGGNTGPPEGEHKIGPQTMLMASAIAACGGSNASTSAKGRRRLSRYSIANSNYHFQRYAPYTARKPEERGRTSLETKLQIAKNLAKAAENFKECLEGRNME